MYSGGEERVAPAADGLLEETQAVAALQPKINNSAVNFMMYLCCVVEMEVVGARLS